MLGASTLEEDKVATEMEGLCLQLFCEWLLDLDANAREIWLWNALVSMEKLRRSTKA
jgi:hypothetical protein